MSRADEELLEIGRIDQIHGLYGTVRIQVAPQQESLLQSGVVLYMKNRRGDFIPARVENLRIQEKRNRRLFFVKFDRIANRSEAETFIGKELYIRHRQSESEADSETLVGFTVEDPEGAVGVVTSVLQNPAHAIIEIAVSGEMNRNETILIPWVDVYIKSIDREKRTVKCHDIDPLKTL